MFIYRICNTQYAKDTSGLGAKLFGGRWNNKGNAILYTSSTRALAALEVLVHLQANQVKPIDFSLVTLFAPDNSISEIKYEVIKAEINKYGLTANFKSIGDEWIKNNKSLLLKVPSIVIPEEYNFLINPLHKDFHKIKIDDVKPFDFDRRLVK